MEHTKLSEGVDNEEQVDNEGQKRESPNQQQVKDI